MKENILIILSLILLTDMLDTAGQLLLKRSVNDVKIGVNNIKNMVLFVLRLMSLPRLWMSFVLSAFSLCVWLIVLSKVDLNLAFSLDSMRYVLIAAASVIFLKEKVGALRWMGIMCVAAGIVLVTLG